MTNEETDAIPVEDIPPAGLLLRPLLSDERAALDGFREAVLAQRVALSSREPDEITRGADLVGFRIQLLAQSSERRRRRTLGLGLIDADTPLQELATYLDSVGDDETAQQCRDVREIALLAAQDAKINRRIAEGQLGVSQGVLSAIREAATREPLGYDPHETSGPTPGSIVNRHA